MFCSSLFLQHFLKTRRGSPVDNRLSIAEAPPIGKINPFSKIAVTLEPVMDLGALQDLESPKKLQHSLFND